MSRYDKAYGTMLVWYLDKLQQKFYTHTQTRTHRSPKNFYCLLIIEQQNIFDKFQVFNTKTILFQQSFMLQSFDDVLY